MPLKTKEAFVTMALLTLGLLAGCSSGTTNETSNKDSLAVTLAPDTVSVTENRASTYLETLSPSEGMTPVRSEEGWGFVDDDGQVVVKCQYIGVSPFKNGRALVHIREENWRNAYQYIDKENNNLGLFFVNSKPDTCISVTVINSDESGERYSRDVVTRCPNGSISYKNMGWEWGSSETFYPGISIEQAIKLEEDELKVFQNFDGVSKEYVEGDYKYVINVEKNADGTFKNIAVGRSSDFNGSDIEFALVEGGVLVKHSNGS